MCKFALPLLAPGFGLDTQQGCGGLMTATKHTQVEDDDALSMSCRAVTCVRASAETNSNRTFVKTLSSRGHTCSAYQVVHQACVECSLKGLRLFVLAFSRSICGSGGGTTIWLDGCNGNEGAAGASGAGAGGRASLRGASLGEMSLSGASRTGGSLKLGSLPLYSRFGGRSR